jgi:hypothetical protein
VAQEAGRCQRVQKALLGKVKRLHENKTKLEEAFVYQRAIDEETYKEMRATLTEELTLAEMELRDVQAGEIQIEAVLDFAQGVLLNASNLWKASPSEQKQRLQQVLFPEGLTYSEGRYRTNVTCLLFSGMPMQALKKEGLVDQTVSSWNQTVSWLQEMDSLRREGCLAAFW